ncbi:MAG: hypothetical protein ABIG29_01145 [Candidatus Nealsonbacteria bacterium]
MMIEGEMNQRNKIAALLTIGLRSDAFKWNLQGTILDKSALLQAVSRETREGALIVEMAREIVGTRPKNDSYQPGNTAICLLCGNEIPIVKAGILACCGQNMEIKAPRLIPPSSD